VFGAAGVAGAILAGRAIDAHGPIPVVLTGLALIVAALLGFAALAKAAAASNTVILAALLMGIYGGGTWAITPAQQYRLLGANENERILLSLNASALYAGVAVGAAAGGIVLAVNGSVPALCLSAAAFELAAATVLLL
jgi:DHA1 family inner membrane transport protein